MRASDLAVDTKTSCAVWRGGGPIAPRRLAPAAPNRIVFACLFSLGRACVAGRKVALGKEPATALFPPSPTSGKPMPSAHRVGSCRKRPRNRSATQEPVEASYRTFGGDNPDAERLTNCGAIPETNSKHDGFTRSNRRCFNEKVGGRFADVVDEWGLLVCPAGVGRRVAWRCAAEGRARTRKRAR